MDTWHRNVRLMHQIDEFLDLDSSRSHLVTDFIALIDAVREGLTQIDENLQIPDAQINLLFLTKLKSRPEWKDWASAMLRDSRVNSSKLTVCLTFKELGELAIEHEKTTLKSVGDKEKDTLLEKAPFSSKAKKATPQNLTQDEINAFVVRQMNEGKSSRHNRSASHTTRGHAKRPSQEEINEYVIRQMRQEQEQTTRGRSYSQPEPRTLNQPRSQPLMMRCSFCGDSYHQSAHCWRRWRVAVEALQENPVPKHVDTRNGIPRQPRIYLSGFTPF